MIKDSISEKIVRVADAIGYVIVAALCLLTIAAFVMVKLGSGP